MDLAKKINKLLFVKIGCLKIKTVFNYRYTEYELFIDIFLSVFLIFFKIFSFQIESSVPSQLLESVLQELKGLQEFLDRNSQFAGGPLGNPR